MSLQLAPSIELLGTNSYPIIPFSSCILMSNAFVAHLFIAITYPYE